MYESVESSPANVWPVEPTKGKTMVYSSGKLLLETVTTRDSREIQEMQFANIAAWDRALRVFLGVAMLAAGWFSPLPEVWSLALKIFGWVPLLTGLLGWSPLYSLLQIRTQRNSCRRR